ncbi:flagellar basal-body MS-ring/collar protein FliF [Scatolibacter rhodanostii]|uniref:flagellar basal-body MS-ring/collar protein FliF n=1 Tax=Scatolibacter rhodanostii TaxID=2014781 RepID=UPI000C071D77|nr:flagellar basal-body MS-ring/collar protein FliF [Scatolibacter rhodanostii]
MKDQKKIKDYVVRVKEYVVEMPKKRKITVGIVLAAIIVLAVVVTLVLNAGKSNYRVMYSNIEASEATKVYEALKELGAEPTMSASGEVMVPANEYDIRLLQLAEKGFPQTTLSYDIFSSNSGMTVTESERKQWLIYQLQDRIQDTLKRVNGVENAVVTITVPETSDYVWEQATDEEKASASVLLTLQAGEELSSSQVTSIKNLVAAAVPKMEASEVTVVDAKSSLELLGEAETTGISINQNLKFEQTVQAQIEDNIKRVLTPRYGSSGVVAVAKVTLNYDKMVTESMQLQEKPEDEGGGGYATHTKGQYTLNNAETVDGIVGEENNTDIPTYGYTNPDGDENTTYYSWDTDIDYSYIKTQVEKGNAVLERATVSVMVDEENLTQARRTELINLISNSADIQADLVFVSSFDAAAADVPAVAPPAEEEQQIWDMIPTSFYFIAAGIVFLIFLLLGIIIISRRRAKRAKVAAALQEQEEERLRIQNEIAAHKKQLSEAASSGLNASDDAVMTEVKDFAKTNPEITANLLRSWLKEGE